MDYLILRFKTESNGETGRFTFRRFTLVKSAGLNYKPFFHDKILIAIWAF